jgi:hypothetical protein
VNNNDTKTQQQQQHPNNEELGLGICPKFQIHQDLVSFDVSPLTGMGMSRLREYSKILNLVHVVLEYISFKIS